MSLFRLGITIENGMSTTTIVQRALVYILSGYVRDAKFVDDEQLMLAVNGKCKSYSGFFGSGTILTVFELHLSYCVSIIARKDMDPKTWCMKTLTTPEGIMAKVILV